jgi:multiple sugar transport system permease protein
MTAWTNHNNQKNHKGFSLFILLSYFFSFLYALLIIIPLYFVIISAFKNNIQIITTPLALPSHLDFGRFFQIQTNVNILHAVTISILVAIGAELVTLLIAFPAAYAVARIQTRLGKIVESIISLGFLIPSLAILMPVYLMTAKVGLLYNPIALVLLYPAVNLPLSLILLTSFMRKLPRELEESAVMDGATVLEIIFHIFVPICTPGILTVVILNFLNIWNEYLFALILMDSKSRTIQVALGLLQANQRSIDYGLIAAGVLISMIPVYLVFIFFQDKIMSGMLTGAIKE